MSSYRRHKRWGRAPVALARRDLLALTWQFLQTPQGAALLAWLLLVDPGVGKTWAMQQALIRQHRAGWSGVALWVAQDCKAALEAWEAFRKEDVPTVLLVGRRLVKGAEERFDIVREADQTLRDVTTCREVKAIAATAKGLSPGASICGAACAFYSDCRTSMYAYLSARIQARERLVAGAGVIVTTADSEETVYQLAEEVESWPAVVVRDEHHSPGELHVDMEGVNGPLSLHDLLVAWPDEHTGCEPLCRIIEALERALGFAREQLHQAKRLLREEDRRRAMVGLKPAVYRWEAASAGRLVWPTEPTLGEAAEIVRCGWGGWLVDVPGVDGGQLQSDAASVLSEVKAAAFGGCLPWKLFRFLALLAAGSPVGVRMKEEEAPYLWGCPRPPTVPAGAKLILLDATGDPEEVAAATGRQVRSKEIRVLPSPSVRAILHKTSLHQRSNESTSPERVFRRWFLSPEFMGSLRWVKEGREALGESAPHLAVVVGPLWSFKRYGKLWAWLDRKLEAEGFTVRRFHWRSVYERGTNDFTGAALVWSFGTPYPNLGGLVRAQAVRAWWEAMDAGLPYVLPERLELEGAEVSAEACLLQVQGRSRSLVDPRERRFLHVCSGQMFPQFMEELVIDELGEEIELGGSLEGDGYGGVSFEAFFNAIRERGLVEVCAERIPEGVPAPVSIAHRQEYCARAGGLLGWSLDEEPRRRGGRPVKIWRSVSSGSKHSIDPDPLIGSFIRGSGSIDPLDPLEQDRGATPFSGNRPDFATVQALLDAARIRAIGPELFPPGIAAAVNRRTLTSWAERYAKAQSPVWKKFPQARPAGRWPLKVYAGCEADAEAAAKAFFEREAA